MKKWICKFSMLLCLLLLCAAASMYGQEAKTLFNANGQPSSTSGNLDNLFRNFPIMVQNHSRVKFLTYQSMGLVKNGKKAASYLKKNFQKGPQWRMVVQEATKVSKGNLTHKVATIDTDVVPFAKDKYQMMADQWGEKLVGYEVFKVQFTLDTKPYTYYVFVNTQTHSTFLEGNIFGAEF